MKLHDIDDIKKYDFVGTDAEKARFKFLCEFAKPKNLIKNAKTDMRALKVGEQFLPTTITHRTYNNCYLCSVYSTFISCGLDECSRLDWSLAKVIFLLLIKMSDGLLRRAEIDQVVSVNNFLLSINLYPDMNNKELLKQLTILQKQYSQHAFCFSSLNHHSDGKLIKALQRAGFLLYPMKQIYVFDKDKKDFTQQRNYGKDMKILRKQKTHDWIYHDDIKQSDYQRMADLYNKLYTGKYSKFGPQFNANFIASSHKTKMFDYAAIRNKDGVIDAFIGCYDVGDTTAVPIVGYDVNLSKKLGLYRILSAYCINRADEKKMTLNMGAGASYFKISRGGIPYIEYNAYYINHLKGLSFLTWKSLYYVINYILLPFMKGVQEKKNLGDNIATAS